MSSIVDIKKAKYQYNKQKRMAVKRLDASGNPIQFLLTFSEWCKIWEESGHYADRGRKSGQYCMSRVNDIGPYSVDNVFIQLTGDNTSEAFKGKARSDEAKRKQSVTRIQRGLRISDSNKLALSKAHKGKPKPTSVCPHCGKIGAVTQMPRWHFDNCKERDNNGSNHL